MNRRCAQALANAVDAAAERGADLRRSTTTLLAPTFAAANSIDISSLRQRGNVEFDLGKKLPFDLAFTYMREAQDGLPRRRAAATSSAGSSIIVDLPEPLNEIMQDFGFRAAYNFKMGQRARRVQPQHVQQPGRDAGWSTTRSGRTTWRIRAASAVPDSAAASVRMINAPDNEASTGSRRLPAEVHTPDPALGDSAAASWTQNAAFYPYTINSAILTDTGQPANDISSLQQQSLNGKINTTTLNFSFSSRPIRGLGLRARYRSYDHKDKSARYVITADTKGTPDGRWDAAAYVPAQIPTVTQRRIGPTLTLLRSTSRPATTSRL